MRECAALVSWRYVSPTACEPRKRDGVHAFVGSGPAGPRPPLSARLPCKLSTLIDVAGGGKAAPLLCQDPKVALATGPNVAPGLLNNPNLSGVLYRSADSGRSWQRVTPEISPPIPASSTPGA